MLGNWLYHYFGINGTGPWYGFWSGVGADISELAIFTAIIAGLRHHNCHIKGCWRLGRPVEGTPYIACHVHHPAHPRASRGVSLEKMRSAFKEAVR